MFQLLSDYDDTISDTVDNTNTTERQARTQVTIVETEIDEYTRLDMPKEDCDLIKWWADHQESLPLLTKLALGVLAIPASSASAESNFSSAGFVVSDRRSQIDSTLLESILVCRSNSDLL